jgi:hypothetical protein
VVICVKLCWCMTRALVTDEADVLRNVLNEQLRTADKGWISSKIGRLFNNVLPYSALCC